MANRITIENSITIGVTDKSYWDAAQSDQIEGFATDISVNAGQTVTFKINVNGTASDTLPYIIEIYRLGYYGGAGAREVAEITNPDGTVQPNPLFDESRGLVDAGNWAVTDSWQIPADAVSGVYLARIQRLDADGNPIEGATNQIPFIVRNDGVAADIVLQTSDTTWQAYNGWGGNNGQIGPNFYGDPTNMVDNPPPANPGLNSDRAYAVSYNRPFLTRDGGGAAAGPQDYLFGADFAAIFWLEKNGYDVSYISGVDTDRLGASYLENYDAYISVGHDEYWSGGQRANVEAARDAGVNLLFWSGNEVYWKTRWEDAFSADGTPYRTLVCYKETWANGDPNAGPADYANIDPSNEWTGTWRDMRFVGNPGATGQEPENSLTGQLFGPDGTGEFGGALDVPESYAALRYWRDTTVQANDGAENISAGLIGYEWNVVPNDAYRPEGLITLSSTTLNWSGILVDQGNRTQPGTATHNLSLYRAESGALVFGAGTVFWTWGLSNEHDSSPYGANIENTALQQFTVNLFADMGIQPESLQAGLTLATQSTDVTPASTAINDVPAEVTALSSETITGTATDNDGNPGTDDGVVALVELSFDGGVTWKVATGTTDWSYSWRPTAEGTYQILARAIDDSLNVHNATPDMEAVTVTAAVPPNTFSLFELDDSISTSSNVDTPVELGMRFYVDRPGDVIQLRYYRSTSDSGDTDTREGRLWRVSDGQLLGTVTFVSGPDESGWQVADLATPVTLEAGVDYIVSYHTSGNYVASRGFFAPANEVAFDGVDDDAFTDPFGVISAPQDSGGRANGVFHYGSGGTFPTTTFDSSNYWVDVTFAPSEADPNTAPVITSGDFTAAENQTIAGTVTATDSDGDTPQYSIAGGADAGLFNINITTGVLTFAAAPNYEAPADAGADNVYNVTVRATDGLDPVTKAITVTVTDVQEDTFSVLFGPAATPSDFSSDASSYELGTKFFSSQDGTITALRYYRGTEDSVDTDVRTLRLWDTTTQTLLGSVEVTSAPGATGWQVGTLATPISITAGTNYIVSYGYVFGADDRYAATQNYFNNSHTGPDGILTAPASGGTTGGAGNGLFSTSGPGSIPTNTFNNSNYWVDVHFEAAGTGGENVPPEFTSSAVFNTPEIQLAIGTVTATDANSDPLAYAIAGGDDADLFTIGASSGRLRFNDPQDYEGSDNIFEVTVSVSDGTSPPVLQAITVNLTDVDDTADGPAAMTGELLKAEYIFGDEPTELYNGPGASQTATVGDGVEFQNLPSAGPAVGNGDHGLATVDVREQTVRIEFPLDRDVFPTQTFLRFAGPADGRPYNGVLLSDADGTLATIRSVQIIGQEGFTTSTGVLQPLTASDLTITADGIFLNVSDKGRLVDVDPDTPGAQAAWVELLVDLNDAPAITTPLVDQTAQENSAFTYTVPVDAFADADGDTLTYSATLAGGAPLPAWLSFHAATRTFSGTPDNGDIGSINVTVTADDGYTTGTDSFAITVANSGALIGTSGDDTMAGTANADLFLLQQGGNDQVSGLGGNDGFYFGAALTSADSADGGAGHDDQVGLQGDYSSGLTINAANFPGIETFALMAGDDTGFGDPGTNLYSYNLTTAGSFGRNIIINGNSLRVGENVTFDGSAETSGSFTFFSGFGIENLTGGGGDDGFYFGPGRFGAGDQVNGGGGSDNQLGLRGDYTIDFNSAGYTSALTNIQTIALLSDMDPSFSQIGDGEFDYALTLSDSMVATGQQLTVTGGGLGNAETMVVNGSAEASGSFRMIGGAADDILQGGGGDDFLFGGLGVDTLTGGGGSDRFIYTDVLQSSPSGRDGIQDFEHNIDKLDMAGIDADSFTAGDQMFAFIGSAAFSGTGASSAGQLRAQAVSGDIWQVSGDVDGDGLADFDVIVALGSGQPLTAGDMFL